MDVDVEDEEDEEELSISEEAQIAVSAVVIFASAELWRGSQVYRCRARISL